LPKQIEITKIVAQDSTMWAIEETINICFPNVRNSWKFYVKVRQNREMLILIEFFDHYFDQLTRPGPYLF
jgi:hypothetical protein